MLKVDIVSKVFSPSRGASRQVLKNIAFTAARGEILALVGPSGVGKTTILRIILGLDRRFTGSVELLSDRVGVMFQEPRLLPWLSVEENLSLVGCNPADIGSLLQEVLLPPVRTALPSALSLGMARRVALARALAVDPEVLILDEPFASLDAGLTAALGAHIADRSRRLGTIVLLSTHDLDQALAMATRILVIADQPASLAADIPLPAGNDIGGIRDHLLARFSFLGRNST